VVGERGDRDQAAAVVAQAMPSTKPATGSGWDHDGERATPPRVAACAGAGDADDEQAGERRQRAQEERRAEHAVNRGGGAIELTIDRLGPG
jgi:hypothetical protein